MKRVLFISFLHNAFQRTKILVNRRCPIGNGNGLLYDQRLKYAPETIHTAVVFARAATLKDGGLLLRNLPFVAKWIRLQEVIN